MPLSLRTSAGDFAKTEFSLSSRDLTDTHIFFILREESVLPVSLRRSRTVNEARPSTAAIIP